MNKNIIMIGPYLPGKNFGGPVKSITNIVDSLYKSYNFYIITGDRDLNSTEPYSNVSIGEWNQVGNAKVYYLPKGKEFQHLLKLFQGNLKFDLLFANSFFSKLSVIVQLLKLFGIIKFPILVAPRGEFSKGALSLKSVKKRIYIKAYKLFKVKQKVTYTCSSYKDKEDIERILGSNTEVIIAENIVKRDVENLYISPKKEKGCLRLVSLSRISRIKNIDYSLKILNEISDKNNDFTEIIFDIYGPIEDSEYWAECNKLMIRHNTNIKVEYKGVVSSKEVINILSQYHVLLFPTKGENFGHVIHEALLAGCPLLISDQTPWRNLSENGVGYEIPLENPNLFIKAINQFLYMDSSEYNFMSRKAQLYGLKKVEDQLSIDQHINMFNNILQ